jgi:protein-arginine kinase activator protein McsA
MPQFQSGAIGGASLSVFVVSQSPVFDMLCESCHQREANHHITTCINADVVQKRDLCPECFLTNSPDASPESRRLATAQRDARCVYCGGQPYLCGTVLPAILRGDQNLKFVCIPCSIEHNRYLQEHSDLMGKLNEEADQHMKEWVSQRGHDEDA